MDKLKIGDWFVSTSAGIWQIYRIDNFKSINPMTDKIEDKTLVFGKRFINDAGKRSFTQNFFSPSLIFKLEGVEIDNLNDFIKDNVEIYEKFEQFEPKPINSIYSVGIETPKDKSPADIASLIPKNKKLNVIQIRELVDSLGFDTKSYPQWTIQFISKGTELHDNFVQYIFNKVLEF